MGCIALQVRKGLQFGAKTQMEALSNLVQMWWGDCLASYLPLYVRNVNAFHICTLILLQTDSSPSMSLAQLTKVPCFKMMAVTQNQCFSSAVAVFLVSPRVDILYLSHPVPLHLCFRQQTW